VVDGERNLLYIIFFNQQTDFKMRARAAAFFLWALCVLPALCNAADLRPWFGKEYEVELGLSLLYQNYSSLATSCRRQATQGSNSAFLTLHAQYPFRLYCVEFEATAAASCRQHPGWDNFRLIGRRQLLRESEGLPATLTAGFILTQPLTRALHDISSFHHGHLEGEAFLSLGKSYGGCAEDEDFSFRCWAVGGIGTADVGLPWIRADAACEYNIRNKHKWRLILNTLWGNGKKPLNPCHFKGYGCIHHQSIDCGLRYTYGPCCCGELRAQYLQRVYARNFPDNAHLLFFEYCYPFGVQLPYDY
jgi:hypothetical protein